MFLEDLLVGPILLLSSKQRKRMEKVAREENEEGVGSLNNDKQLNSEREADYCSVSKSEKQCSEKGEGKKDGVDGHAEASDESDNFSDVNDDEVDGCIHNEEERRYKKILWEEMNREYLEQAALKAASEALYASNSNCPEHARKRVEASKAAVTKSRKEKQKKRAEEANNVDLWISRL